MANFLTQEEYATALDKLQTEKISCLSNEDYNKLVTTLKTKLRNEQGRRNKLTSARSATRKILVELHALDTNLDYLRGALKHTRLVGPEGMIYGENKFTYGVGNKKREAVVILYDNTQERTAKMQNIY